MDTILTAALWYFLTLGLVGAYAFYQSKDVDMSDDYRTIYDWYSDDDEE